MSQSSSTPHTKKSRHSLNKLYLSLCCVGLSSFHAIASEPPKTAPGMRLGINPLYSNQQGIAGEKQAISVYFDSDAVINAEQKLRVQAPSARGADAYPGFATLPIYEPNQVYAEPGNIVKYTNGDKHGVFKNKYWVQGQAPSFDPVESPWEMVVQTTANGEYMAANELIATWLPEGVYESGDKVKFAINSKEYHFEAKYWTQGNQPLLTKADGGTAEAWDTPWVLIANVGGDIVGPEENPPTPPPPPPFIPTPPPVQPEPTPEPDVKPEPEKPEISPPKPEQPNTNTPDPVPPPEGNITPGTSELPAEGYAFLRELTDADWNWFFPLRSGVYNMQGSTRNFPPIANPDGSTDVFTLSAFKNATLEYNAWAARHGYKQFLNRGTKSQQAMEFTAFWAKSSRETSGAWANAPAPWIVNDPVAGTVWKGGLYWVEEVGYTTNPDGTSAAINYVDQASAYKPAPGRSYYGRGVIQLSWNYNYGQFSEWLYNNGMMKNLITAKDTLLYRPDYVATNGSLSILSGIWFWMTPQGPKPSSQDVIYGDITNVSKTTQEEGLPQRNDGGEILVAEGASQDQSVNAYRLGTIINIVNGGLECNRQSSWHSGPLERVSYYNAYAKYLNHKIKGIQIPVVDAATNVWTQKVSESSPDDLKTATCYAMKAYFGW